MNHVNEKNQKQNELIADSLSMLCNIYSTVPGENKAAEPNVKKLLDFLTDYLSKNGKRKIETTHTIKDNESSASLTYYIDDILVNSRISMDYFIEGVHKININADFLKNNGNLQKVEFKYNNEK